MTIFFNERDGAVLCAKNRLTLHFKIEYFVLSSSQQVIEVPDGRLGDHLSGLLHSGESADIILKCKGEQFNAHKIILAARSPVFAAIFKHDLKEKKNCAVDIVDKEKDVLREMLKYMYTDTASNLEKLAARLLAAADKVSY